MKLFYTIFNSLTHEHQRHRPLGGLGHLRQHQGQLCQPQGSSGDSFHASAYGYGVEKRPPPWCRRPGYSPKFTTRPGRKSRVVSAVPCPWSPSRGSSTSCSCDDGKNRKLVSARKCYTTFRLSNLVSLLSIIVLSMVGCDISGYIMPKTPFYTPVIKFNKLFPSYQPIKHPRH